MHLNCHTYYSLRFGMLSPEQLVAGAKERGIDQLALTDINNTSCLIEFVTLCKKAGIRPIAGIEFRQDNRFLYIGLAKNQEGLFQLNQLLSQSSLEGSPLSEVPPDMPETYVIYKHDSLPKPPEDLAPNEYIGIRPGEAYKLFRSPLLAYKEKLVLLQPVVFTHADEKTFQAHRLLRAIDKNVVLSKLEDATDCAQPADHFLDEEKMLEKLQPYGFIAANTFRLMHSCRIDFSFDIKVNRHTYTGSKEADFTLLSQLALQGYKKRYGGNHAPALKRIRQELEVIKTHDFCTYFLIAWDFVRFAQTSDYWHVGRGSGANSIVAYCLGITDVEPIDLDLYFERFINPYRTSPPDFDIDFSWKDRDQVLEYVYKRYQSNHVALLAAYSTFNFRSIVRELGKAYGLPKSEIDLIVSQPTAIQKHHELAAVILESGALIEGFPNYLSIHAGGVIISEKPLNYYTATQMMPKGFVITHFDMHHAEEFGFHKFDILSQRGLGHIRDAIDLVRKNRGRAVLVDDIPAILQDEQVKNRLRRGDCLGCFYIESPAMRGLLKKLRCDTFKHLVAASSIIRPGVAKSGMMKEYISRFHHPEKVQYLHPVFEQHLGETFGVMVYQEDTLKVLHHFAGLDLGESDVLRRIMTGKKFKKDTLERLYQKYLENCKTRGYPFSLAKEVWRQVESFSGYSFCKAHSASFAVESFQSLYLKTYYPVEHAVAVTNNFGGFYRSEIYLHEARMHGATLHPPCVNKSEWLVVLEGREVYLGFIFIKDIESELCTQIIAERRQGGCYRDLGDFLRRVEVSVAQLDLLIRAGAFRFTGLSKCALMWEKSSLYKKDSLPRNGSLFGFDEDNICLPQIADGPFDQAFDEIELLGFPLCAPFDLLQDAEQYNDCILAADLSENIGKRVKILGYYVCKKDVRTVNKDLMAFGTWLDRPGHFFDTVHFAQSLKKFPLRGKGIYRIEGLVVQEFDFPSIEVLNLERLNYVSDGRF